MTCTCTATRQLTLLVRAEFVRNNRGINDRNDLPLAYLETLYDEIKGRQIQVDIGVSEAATQVVDYTDTATWNKLIRQGSVDQAPAAFTPTIAARKSALMDSGVLSRQDASARLQGQSFALQDRDMFLMMSRPLLETALALWDHVSDDLVLGR